MSVDRRFSESHRLSDVENGRDNNLNLVRFLLASLVILAHAYDLLGLTRPWAPVEADGSGSL